MSRPKFPSGDPSLIAAVPPPHVRIGETPGVLDAIREADVNLAIWCRSLDGKRLNGVALDEVDDVAAVGPADQLDVDLAASGYPMAVAQGLGDEIAMLARVFSVATGVAQVSIRLDVIESDACRRFHADYVTARLICTLIGPGTQWLDAADAAALGRGEGVDGLTIRSVGTGDVALFKGRLWSPEAPIVHRSPPIATTGERRLLLVIDPAADDPSTDAIMAPRPPGAIRSCVETSWRPASR